jgi:hypothetical protein
MKKRNIVSQCNCICNGWQIIQNFTRNKTPLSLSFPTYGFI